MTIILITISQFLEAFCPTMLTADHFHAQTYCMKRKIIVDWVMFSFFLFLGECSTCSKSLYSGNMRKNFYQFSMMIMIFLENQRLKNKIGPFLLLPFARICWKNVLQAVETKKSLQRKISASFESMEHVENIWLLDKYAIIISSLVIQSGIQLELLIWTYAIRVISEAYSVCVSKCGRKGYWGCSQGVTSASWASDWCHFLSVPPITESGPSWSLAVTESSYFWETLLESSSQKNPARLHSSDSNSNSRWVNNFLNVSLHLKHMSVSDLIVESLVDQISQKC